MTPKRTPTGGDAVRENRGFHFLIGIAIMWLFWRLLITGVLHDIGFLAVQSEQAFRGPGAILIAFVIESIIAVGAVAALVVTGLWQAVYHAGVLVQDAFKMLVEYLDAWKGEREKPAVAIEKSAAVKTAKDVIESQPPPDNPLIGAIIDTRQQMQQQQILIERMASQLDAMQPKPPAPTTEPEVSA